MFFYGMIGFPVASYLSVLGVSLFFRLATHPVKFAWLHLGWLIFAAAILPLHVQSVITFLPPMIVLMLFWPGLLSRRLIGWSVAATTLALLVNSVWLIPAIHHRGDDVSTAIVDQLQLFASNVSHQPGTDGIDWETAASLASRP